VEDGDGGGCGDVQTLEQMIYKKFTSDMSEEEGE
jgi:hypothetical protein